MEKVGLRYVFYFNNQNLSEEPEVGSFFFFWFLKKIVSLSMVY